MDRVTSKETRYDTFNSTESGGEAVMTPKPEHWDETLRDCINQGKNYKITNAEMKELYGDDHGVGGSTYRKYRKEMTGGPEVDSKLGDIKEVLDAEKPQKKKAKLPAWTKTKQTAADTSKLAVIINKGMYHGLMPFCKNKELKEEDVQEVNFGGAVVGTVGYFFPDINMEHPLILLATRGIILYLKFKAICSKIVEIKDKLSHIGGEQVGDIKQEWVKESHK
jgi:hypothetical protein